MSFHATDLAIFVIGQIEDGTINCYGKSAGRRIFIYWLTMNKYTGTKNGLLRGPGVKGTSEPHSL